ncbi:MAG: glutathione S-transferase N-terminal domain-containing protein [Nitrospirota bacterium]|nr:MAG: glutathione S-transferase N-terminal domain-containing protein [Nitrospirota bacterium]
MKLYHTEWCPECEVVRQKLTDRNIVYDDEIVSDVRPFRKSVYEVSGQYYVPVLVDGETVLTETEEIMNYLDNYIANRNESGAASNLHLSSQDERKD